MEAASVEGFIQQVERLVRAGYSFYVHEKIPEHADPAAVDAKISAKYQADLSRWAKYRRYHSGKSGEKRCRPAKIACLRYSRDLVILATPGKSAFFEQEKPRNFGRKALRIFGYAISRKNGRVKIEVSPEQFAVIREEFRRLACRLPVEQLEQAFRDLELLPYYHVKKQLFRLLKTVNTERAKFGLATMGYGCLPLRFKRVPVFPRR